jgi:hypothetical protein
MLQAAFLVRSLICLMQPDAAESAQRIKGGAGALHCLFLPIIEGFQAAKDIEYPVSVTA